MLFDTAVNRHTHRQTAHKLRLNRYVVHKNAAVIFYCKAAR